MESKKRINVSVDHGGPAFFVDNITISHSQQKFVFDFVQTSPRFDQIGESNQQTLVVKHKAMVMDPALAKIFLKVLKENLERYEKKFGKITIPKKRSSVKKGASKAAKVTEATSKYIG